VNANAGDARRHAPRLPFLPRASLFIVSCMDCRIDPEEYLGLEFGQGASRAQHGRADRAGGHPGHRLRRLPRRRQAPDGPYFEVAIIHHTDCGSRLLEDEQLRHGFAERGGCSPPAG
jgi:carbonic anhydrase